MDEKDAVLGNLVRGMNTLRDCQEFALLIPEVRVNLVYALPEPHSPNDVAAIEGRITAVRGLPHASGMPEFGASDHMARLIIEVQQTQPEIRAGINFKCDATIMEAVKAYCAEKGYSFGDIDRTAEPAEVAGADGSSMPWKIAQLIERFGAVPRLFYEGDGWGKEPLFVAIGRDAVEVAEIACHIARRYAQSM